MILPSYCLIKFNPFVLRNPITKTLGTRIRTKPPPIGLHTPRLCFVFSFLEGSSLYDVSILVPDGLAPREHLCSGDLLCIAIKVLSFHFFEKYVFGRRRARLRRGRRGLPLCRRHGVVELYATLKSSPSREEKAVFSHDTISGTFTPEGCCKVCPASARLAESMLPKCSITRTHSYDYDSISCPRKALSFGSDNNLRHKHGMNENKEAEKDTV